MRADLPIGGFGVAGKVGVRPTLTVGLLNNMSDGALIQTERQYEGLLKAAAPEADVRLRLFALESVERSAQTRSQMKGRYEDAQLLPLADVDALIVTGAEPRTERLEEEAYWPDLADVVDWTRRAATPTIWSCLAAHAAVLRIDGIERQPLATKLSGLFESQPAGEDPLLAGLPATFRTPHSRLNGLPEGDLIRAGYQILTHSTDGGLDAFVRRDAGLALFLQGHLEYDADRLMREYCRDVGRFLRGERQSHPRAPAHYFSAGTERALAALVERARQSPDPSLLPAYAATLANAAPPNSWRAAAVTLYRNWLREAWVARRALDGIEVRITEAAVTGE
jgi:homoserine O-succinyltransferase